VPLPNRLLARAAPIRAATVRERFTAEARHHAVGSPDRSLAVGISLAPHSGCIFLLNFCSSLG